MKATWEQGPFSEEPLESCVEFNFRYGETMSHMERSVHVWEREGAEPFRILLLQGQALQTVFWYVYFEYTRFFPFFLIFLLYFYQEIPFHGRLRVFGEGHIRGWLKIHTFSSTAAMIDRFRRYGTRDLQRRRVISLILANFKRDLIPESELAEFKLWSIECEAHRRKGMCQELEF